LRSKSTLFVPIPTPPFGSKPPTDQWMSIHPLEANIPSCVESVGPDCFLNQGSLSDVIFLRLSHVKLIGARAFGFCISVHCVCNSWHKIAHIIDMRTDQTRWIISRSFREPVKVVTSHRLHLTFRSASFSKTND
jgi:hypothetical protein